MTARPRAAAAAAAGTPAPRVAAEVRAALAALRRAVAAGKEVRGDIQLALIVNDLAVVTSDLALVDRDLKMEAGR